MDKQLWVINFSYILIGGGDLLPGERLPVEGGYIGGE